MKEPLVSILIPCHNSERWVGQAVASALEQSWPNVEVIAVDDGSSDQSLACLRRHESTRVKIIATAQRGASSARNTALRAAQGEFIQYLDADDLLAPTKLSEQLAGSDRDSLLTFGSVIHFDDGQPPEKGILSTATLRAPLHQPLEFLIDLLGGNGPGWMVQTGQWLVPRRISDTAGFWDETLSVDDDGEYFCRVVLASHELAARPGGVCYYRKHRGGNLSAQASRSRRGAASLLASTRLKGRWLRQHRNDPRIAKALAASFNSLALGSYPQAPDVSAEAVAELRALGREVQVTEGTRWFIFFAQLGGWKFARRLQQLALKLRAQKSLVR